MFLQHMSVRKRATVGGAVLFAFVLLVVNFWSSIPGRGAAERAAKKLDLSGNVDGHPIAELMREADARFNGYLSRRPTTFAQVVKSYKQKWERPPPPGFDKWFKFARHRACLHFDDFDQINHDLRPFWSMQPKDMRKLVKGLMEEEVKHSHLAGLYVRGGKVGFSEQTKNGRNYRTDLFAEMITTFAEDLPDMDIVLNRLDQPRAVVPWEELQKALHIEETTRAIPANLKNAFSKNVEVKPTADDNGAWEGLHGKRYMDVASRGCPPESFARNPKNETLRKAAIKSYTLPNYGGIVHNFNTSSDLCTVGPLIAEKHGFLYIPSSISESKKLMPIFGECKVNVNNDILFPANMYYSHDKRYIYDGKYDGEWDGKADMMFWRGITSGGVQTEESWDKMHRHRLVLMTNATHLRDTKSVYPILVRDPNEKQPKYLKYGAFSPSNYAEKYTDVGFSELAWCVPNPDCDFLKPHFTPIKGITMPEQFKYKYLIDVDGHSFSGRWAAFLKSKSLGLKATIFREWQDSRLFAWKHFAPLDNSLEDLYAIMTYFTGLTREDQGDSVQSAPLAPAHQAEAKQLAYAGREWANKVLRREDIEIYMFRLFLEYARLMDDNRDTIGYGGDGSELN